MIWREKGLKKITIVLFLLVGLISCGVYWAFFDMSRLPKGELIEEAQSPDGTYTLKAYVSDGGATTSYAVRGELNFNKGNRKPKNIYWNYREETASMKWIDSDTVQINGRILNVPYETYDFRND
ncbi:hypothetical protein CEF21_03865 [Bacillus sp. FJAT-42376]|uniref:DUF5412 domain-containing protein n=1 Tax=Bacillus sp. FJAT-42376 TaxID=2014076 RepID=UPI000F4FCAAB|nr:DUF5412 domain-containing protein [Bacillus sp. FJAT-42376]AZB41500.1 hypothetical protein CEF21_03865 [Bacillus sp. FJAT-42376]